MVGWGRVVVRCNGSFRKKCQQNCSFLFFFCFVVVLFGNGQTMNKSVIFDISGKNNFDPFSTTSKNFFSKVPLKHSKNGQKFAMSKTPQIR